MTRRPIDNRQPPFSLRLSFDERERLERQAGALSLSAYIKSLLFAEDAPTYRKRRRAAEADEKLLAEILACLGQSRLSNNLNQLAKAANLGTLFFDDDTKADIKRASDDIHAMREMLMAALGKSSGRASDVKQTLSQSFTRAVAHKRVEP